MGEQLSKLPGEVAEKFANGLRAIHNDQEGGGETETLIKTGFAVAGGVVAATGVIDTYQGNAESALIKGFVGGGMVGIALGRNSDQGGE